MNFQNKFSSKKIIKKLFDIFKKIKEDGLSEKKLQMTQKKKLKNLNKELYKIQSKLKINEQTFDELTKISKELDNEISNFISN